MAGWLSPPRSHGEEGPQVPGSDTVPSVLQFVAFATTFSFIVGCCAESRYPGRPIEAVTDPKTASAGSAPQSRQDPAELQRLPRADPVSPAPGHTMLSWLL